MRLRQMVFAAGAPLVFAALVGCGSSSKTPAAAAGGANSTGAVTTAGSAGGASSAAAPAKGKVDCAAVKDAIGGMAVNWQLVAQFPRETDVTKWPERTSVIGSLPKFAGQLDTLASALGGDDKAAKAIEFMRGANDIVQKGLGGDATAPKALADYLGSDLVAVLTKQSAIGIAVDAVGC